ncbi:twin-arginine translocation signal domain-containing protein, partial [Mesorhizobium sp. M7A.F.Ca.US.001.01.1.1]
MSREEKSKGDVGRRDFLKLFGAAGAAGAAASALPLGASASADEVMAATADTR